MEVAKEVVRPGCYNCEFPPRVPQYSESWTPAGVEIKSEKQSVHQLAGGRDWHLAASQPATKRQLAFCYRSAPSARGEERRGSVSVEEVPHSTRGCHLKPTSLPTEVKNMRFCWERVLTLSGERFLISVIPAPE